jgi:hypothetical protein
MAPTEAAVAKVATVTARAVRGRRRELGDTSLLLIDEGV